MAMGCVRSEGVLKRTTSAGRSQENAGGPRAGSGAAVRAAMRAAGMGHVALASGWAGAAFRESAGGGSPTLDAHSGQSIAILRAAGLPSPSLRAVVATAKPRQTPSSIWGDIKGEATAAPRYNANQSSARRPRYWALRRDCMTPLSTHIWKHVPSTKPSNRAPCRTTHPDARNAGQRFRAGALPGPCEPQRQKSRVSFVSGRSRRLLH